MTSIDGMIGRSAETAQRLLPPIGPGRYPPAEKTGTPASPPSGAAELLALADQKYTPWRSMWRRQWSNLDQVGYLLFQHRQAVEAEQAGRWARADFFWREAHTTLRRLFEQTA